MSVSNTNEEFPFKITVYRDHAVELATGASIVLAAMMSV